MTNANTSPVSSEVLTSHFDDFVYLKILALPAAEKGRVFQMLSDYADILYQILDPSNHPILDHILGTPGAIQQVVADAGGTVNVDYAQHEDLVKEYDAWKSAK
jgi:hypothetical protein